MLTHNAQEMIQSNWKEKAEGMEDRLRLHIIERELDNTNPDGPFRVGRQKLNREKKRILQRLEGRDPKWFATGGGKKDYRMKKVVMTIMNEIERR